MLWAWLALVAALSTGALTAGVPAVLAAPRLVSQTAVEKIPGDLVAWRDSTWYAVSPDSAGGYRLVRGHRFGGPSWHGSLGPHGHGQFLSLSPDLKSVLVSEPDSLGRRFLQLGVLPAAAPRRAPGVKASPAEGAMQWRALTPVTDSDPHVTWRSGSGSFVYQDLLDDEMGMPSLFEFSLATMKPQLLLRGGQKPLLAPTDDAVAFVGVDTTRKVVIKDVESYFPVGLDDVAAKEFRWIMPLRTWVPTRGGWSPDGQRVALVGYAADSTGSPIRKLHVYSRAGQESRSLTFPGDSGRPDRDHASDVATWSPDARWIAVARAFGRGTADNDPGWLWLVSPGGYDAARISPEKGSWRGAPLWIDRRKLVIADGASGPSGGHRYWIVEIAD